MTYVFVLDASACSGCKACQVACKDKNQLPLGVLWRRVYEVSGGAWKQEGAAWSSTLFAYNLSLSCNHCVYPQCADVCPVNAYAVRQDGIVILDSSKCVGCGYCSWACPYDAPQYDRAAGRMTKCDFCHDNLELGLAPACVAACPMRVLDYAEVNGGQKISADQMALWETPPSAHPYPMPGNSNAQPHLAIKPHAAMKSAQEKSITNHEEVHPQETTRWEEAPLVAFTLFIQMAVGSFWAMLWLFHDIQLQFPSMLLIGLCLGAGLMASLAHLGNRRNAWRALSHLSTSWLSREILFTLLFGAGWLATLISMILHANPSIFSWFTAFIGVGLLYCMSQVYRLPSVPVWDSWRTNMRFFLSAALLGILGMIPILAWIRIPSLQWMPMGFLVIILWIAQAMIGRSQLFSMAGRRLQLWLILAGAIEYAIVFLIPEWFGLYSSIVFLLIVLAEQVAGRWFFYRARTGSR